MTMIRYIRAVERLPTPQRAVVGGAVFLAGTVALSSAMVHGGIWPPLALALVVAPVLWGGWLMNGWFRSLPPLWQKRGTAVPLLLYTLWVVAMSVYAVASTNTDRTSASLVLLILWGTHSVYAASFEPEEFPWERLRWRLGRAIHLRVLMLWFGIVGLTLLVRTTFDADTYRVFVNGTTFTLLVGGVAASLKTYARFRKVCTGVNRHTQGMVRSLEELREATDAEAKKLQQAARRAWDALAENLVTRVDTGFSVPGVSVLPTAAIAALEDLMERALSAGPAASDSAEAVGVRLTQLKAAVQGRIDTAA
ncbi:hypothetical protein G3I19_00440 [Streptomyces sp. SID10853]|uniref:hypothetical protein n=1 Tax=Streptomyces sp. SID10853 TaxID=2706028 RepID=UPI0013C0DE3B|nr:hypothetical protein [Streptomyces sp. SID10853]NDZ77013.1 hypothetical protein [Streptomyces sp. SID10853]